MLGGNMRSYKVLTPIQSCESSNQAICPGKRVPLKPLYPFFLRGTILQTAPVRWVCAKEQGARIPLVNEMI